MATASGTQLLDLSPGIRSDELLEIFHAYRSELPAVNPNTQISGALKQELVGEPISVADLAVEQQAVLFGHRCPMPDKAKVSYGIGALLQAQRRTVGRLGIAKEF